MRELWDALREVRRFRRAIIRSKVKLWTELINDLDRDLWGMPYPVVFKKLRADGASIMEVLPPETGRHREDSLHDGSFSTGH